MLDSPEYRGAGADDTSDSSRAVSSETSTGAQVAQQWIESSPESSGDFARLMGCVVGES